MAGLAPVTLVFAASIPADEREALLAELARVAEVQPPLEQKDAGLVVNLLVVVKDGAGIVADVSAVALLLYNGVRLLRKRGISITLPLRRPKQEELTLDGTQSVEEIAAWLRQHSR